MLSVAPKEGPDGRVQLHASTIVIDNKAVAFVGPAGSGKSTMALAGMSRGAHLLADDITWLKKAPDAPVAICPPNITGRIEARGIGILNAPPAAPAPLHLVVDLGTPQTTRLPDKMTVPLLGHDITLFHGTQSAHFIDAILHYIIHGWAN